VASRIHSTFRVHFFEKGELEGSFTTCARGLKASASISGISPGSGATAASGGAEPWVTGRARRCRRLR
jgi:hypothetical protein